jgi:hypothetical protein
MLTLHICQVKPRHVAAIDERLVHPLDSSLYIPLICMQGQQISESASTAQHCTAQHSTALHSTALHSTAQHCTAQHSTAQHSTAQH